MRVEDTATENWIPFQVFCVCCCGFGVQQQKAFVCSQESCATKMCSAESSFESTGVVAGELTDQQINESQNFCGAAHEI